MKNADVLTGDVTPSGKLSDTIAEKLSDYPADGNHTVPKWATMNYIEDIYVGYRYFETFAKDKGLYPFGYGISYTDFKTTTDDVIISDDKVTVKTTVENTGEFIYLTKGSHNLEIVF